MIINDFTDFDKNETDNGLKIVQNKDIKSFPQRNKITTFIQQSTGKSVVMSTLTPYLLIQ